MKPKTFRRIQRYAGSGDEYRSCAVRQLLREMSPIETPPKVSKILLFVFYYRQYRLNPNTNSQRFRVVCREYYSLTTRGGGTIESGGCRTNNRVRKSLLTIVGGTKAEEMEFPHMASTNESKKKKNKSNLNE